MRVAHTYLAPYKRVLDRAGPCFESLLWRSRQYQEIRFETLAALADFDGRVVADMGCGRADMLAWLTRRGTPFARYIGVDALPEMIAFSRARAAEERLDACTFLEADFASDPELPQRLVDAHGVQTFIFSGSLNTMDEPLAREVLERTWSAVSRVRAGCIAFNFLSDLEDTGACVDTRRFCTGAMVRWAMERTPRVRFRHDYLGRHDASIAMAAP